MFIDRKLVDFALRGVLALIFAALAFWMPQSALLAMTLVFGAFSLVNGAFNLVAAVRHIQKRALGLAAVQRHCRHTYRRRRLVALGSPRWSWLLLWASVGFWAIFTGVLEISAAVRLRQEIKGEIWLAFSGLLSIVLGAIVLWIFFPVRSSHSRPQAGCWASMRQSMVSRFVLELASSQNAPGIRAGQTKFYGYEHPSIHTSIEMTSKESYMQMQYSYRAIDKEFHEPWREFGKCDRARPQAIARQTH